MRIFYSILVSSLLFACTSSKQVKRTASPSATEFDANFFEYPNEKSSVFGRYFFPQGDLRALVIYVDFEEEFLDPKVHDDLKYWPIGEDFPMHNEKSIIQKNQSLIWGYQDYAQFKNHDTNANKNLDNLSAFFYEMSNQKFRFYFETLKHPETQKAISIKIDPTKVTSSSAGRNQLNRLVFEKIRSIYPSDYDWSRFDSRKNSPNYQGINQSDFVKENEYADHQLDFVILLFRNSPHWKPHPNGSKNGVQWRKAIMGTGANEVIGNKNGTPIKVSHEGIRVFNTHRNLHHELEIILHEISHAMLSLPHYNGANKAEGNYFFYPYGWGMMDTYARTISIANAWERWYAGWTEITHDVQANKNFDSTYLLKDYLRKNESMRIKLPHQDNEYLWIEYRKNKHPFYGRGRKNKDRYGEKIEQNQLGVFAFTEKVASSRTQVFSTNSQGTNGIKTLYGKGNFDYVFDDFYLRHYAWNNWALNLTNQGENAYGGQNEAMLFRHDFNENNKIDQPTGNNGAGSKYIDGHNVYEINQEVVRGHYLPNAPIKKSKISAFTNPPITNFQAMNWEKNQLAPVILHSLSIEFSKDKNNDLVLSVNYKDGIIEDDFRMTGPIILPAGEVIQLKKNNTLQMNKSKTVNRFRAVDGDLIEPTNFTVEAEGKLILNENSTWLIQENTSVNLTDGSFFEMHENAKIIVENAKLIVGEVQLSIHPTAKVIIDQVAFSAEEFFRIKNE